MNLCEIGLEVFLKVPVMIIIRFGENNVFCPKYIDIYEFWVVWGGCTYSPDIFCLLFKKMEKVQEHDLY